MIHNYYIIGRNYKAVKSGICAIFKSCVSHILYAKRHGMSPVVDLQHYDNQYFKNGRTFLDNAWEYFFKQPDGKSLSDICENDNVRINDDNYVQQADFTISQTELPRTKFAPPPNDNVAEIMSYLQFSSALQNDFEKSYKEIIGDNKNILGCLLRGTDYTCMKPTGHPIQPDTDEVIETIIFLQKKYAFDKIYLATEDELIYKKFKNKLGDKLIENHQIMFKNTKNKYLSDLPVDKVKLAEEYLLSLYILSKCKYFIGGRTNGVTFVYLLSNCWKNFDFVYLWDLGYFKTGTELKYNNIYEHILSVKNINYENRYYKVYTVLGIKIKIKIPNEIMRSQRMSEILAVVERESNSAHSKK